MIKNKYYIGQRVRVIETGKLLDITGLQSYGDDIEYYGTYIMQDTVRYFLESKLEPLPEKKKIVLWQWLVRGSIGVTEIWSTENSLYEKDGQYIKTGATKEVELP